MGFLQMEALAERHVTSLVFGWSPKFEKLHSGYFTGVVIWFY